MLIRVGRVGTRVRGGVEAPAREREVPVRPDRRPRGPTVTRLVDLLQADVDVPGVLRIHEHVLVVPSLRARVAVGAVGRGGELRVVGDEGPRTRRLPGSRHVHAVQRHGVRRLDDGVEPTVSSVVERGTPDEPGDARCGDLVPRPRGTARLRDEEAVVRVGVGQGAPAPSENGDDVLAVRSRAHAYVAHPRRAVRRVVRVRIRLQNRRPSRCEIEGVAPHEPVGRCGVDVAGAVERDARDETVVKSVPHELPRLSTVRRTVDAVTFVVLERGVGLAGADPEGVIGRIDRERADREPGLPVEDRSPMGTVVGRLPHTTVGCARVHDVSVAHDRGHAPGYETGAAAAVRPERIAVAHGIRVVRNIRELVPRTGGEREGARLTRRRLERLGAHRRRRRGAHGGVLLRAVHELFALVVAFVRGRGGERRTPGGMRSEPGRPRAGSGARPRRERHDQRERDHEDRRSPEPARQYHRSPTLLPIDQGARDASSVLVHPEGIRHLSEGHDARCETLNLGILAHVDAGKTSLTERLLYAAGVIDEIGSVDDGSTQTDSLALERQRGITIKSAVVSFVIDDVTVNLIDTPGHPDFIAEVERVLSVLDGAVLVVSAVEGVQAQTRVLMRTLQRLRIPTLIFVNKIDRGGAHDERVAAGHRREADAGDHRDGIGARPRHPRRRLHAVRRGRRRVRDPAGRSARRARRRDPGRVRRRRDDRFVPPAPRRARGADQAGAGASGVLRLGDHGCGRGRADRRHHRVAAGGGRRRRRPGLGHRVQGRARPGRREDRVRPHVLGNGAHARSAAIRRDNERKVTAISVFDRGSAVQRPSVVAGQIGKLWGLGDIQIGDAIGASRRRPPTATTSRRRRWRRSSSPPPPRRRVRCTSRSPSSPSRTR